MNALKSNPVHDIHKSTMNGISDRLNPSPYRNKFQYPPFICSLNNKNITPAIKTLINSSPTLKALSQSQLPPIPSKINSDVIGDGEDSTRPLDTIFESNKNKSPQPAAEIIKNKDLKKKNQKRLPVLKNAYMKPHTNIKKTSPSPNFTNIDSQSPTGKKSQIKFPKIKNSEKPVSRTSTNCSNTSSHMISNKTEKENKENYIQKYVDSQEPRLTSSQRDLESELTERICSSQASCRSNNSKNMDLRFGSLLSEDGNYAMLKTYEDMIYQELVTLYPHLITRQMYRTNTNDFRNFPSKLPLSKQIKLPDINVQRKEFRQLNKDKLKTELEDFEITRHKNNISRHLDQAMKIYDAIKLMKGQLTTYGNSFNFKNDRYLLNAFIDWKNTWYDIKD